MPTAWAPMPMRPPSMVVMAILNPSPSSPSRLDAGTRQPSNRNSAVSDARMPSFSSVLTTVKPGVPFSTRKALMPRGPFVRSVWAKTRAAYASRPLLTKIFRPSSRYAPPSRRASVLWLVAAATAPGLGHGDAHEAELAHAAHGLPRKARLAVDLLGDGADFLLGEVPRQGLDHLLLVAELDLHGLPPAISPAVS